MLDDAIRKLRKYRLDFKRKHCRHLEWKAYDGNSMKRRCTKCGRCEWLFSLPYPSTTEPSLQWKRMYYDEVQS